MFALEEGVGAARLRYSYPGQPGFLEVGRKRGQNLNLLYSSRFCAKPSLNDKKIIMFRN